MDTTNLGVSLLITSFLTYLKYRSDNKKRLLSSYQSYVLYSIFIMVLSYGLLYYFQQENGKEELPKVLSSSSLVEELIEAEPITSVIEEITEQATSILDVNPSIPDWNCRV